MGEFAQFKAKDKYIPSPPDQYVIDQFVFDLADGDMTKKNWIEDNFTLGEVLQWTQHGIYRGYVLRESTKTS